MSPPNSWMQSRSLARTATSHRLPAMGGICMVCSRSCQHLTRAWCPLIRQPAARRRSSCRGRNADQSRVSRGRAHDPAGHAPRRRSRVRSVDCRLARPAPAGHAPVRRAATGGDEKPPSASESCHERPGRRARYGCVSRGESRAGVCTDRLPAGPSLGSRHRSLPARIRRRSREPRRRHSRLASCGLLPATKELRAFGGMATTTMSQPDPSSRSGSSLIASWLTSKRGGASPTGKTVVSIG